MKKLFSIGIMCALILVFSAVTFALELTWSADTAVFVEEEFDGEMVKRWKGDGLILHYHHHDGWVDPTEVDGVKAFKGSTRARVHYIYFIIEDGVLPDLKDKTVEITMEYLDTDLPGVGLQYDGGGGAFTNSPYWFPGEGTNEWKSYTWTIYDAVFEHGQNPADFRFSVTGKNITLTTYASLTFRKVTVKII